MTGRKMTGREMTGREMTGREMTGREMTGREMTGSPWGWLRLPLFGRAENGTQCGFEGVRMSHEAEVGRVRAVDCIFAVRA